MPQTGRLDPSQIEAVSGSGAPAAPWTVPATAVHSTTFEIDTDAALDALPAMLARPAPTYGRIYVIDYPESPFGAYREALLLVSCRFLLLPRQYLVASIVDSEAARAANAQNSHYRSQLGQITIEREGNSAISTVTASGVDLRIVSPDGVDTGADVLRYDPIVVVQSGEDGPQVLTVSAAPESIRDAFIAIGTTIDYRAAAAGTPWANLRCTNPITGTYARMDLAIPEPRPVEPPPMMAAAQPPSSS